MLYKHLTIFLETPSTVVCISKRTFYAAQTYGLAASISYDFLRCNAKKQVSRKITSSTLGYRQVCASEQLYSPVVYRSVLCADFSCS